MLERSLRRRWLYVALSGMDMTVLTALWLLVTFWIGWSWSPWGVWGVLWIGFLCWTVVIELLGRWRVSLTTYRLIVTVLIVLTSLALVRLLFYRGLPWSSWSWLRETLFVAPFDWRPRPRLELVVMVTNVLVALRAAAMSDRNLYDRFVLESFLRAWMGFSALAVMLELVGGPSLWPFMVVVVLAGSIATLLARVETRASSVHTAGHSLAPRHWLTLLGLQGAGVMGGWLSGPLLERALWQALALLGALLSALFALLIAAFLAVVQAVLPGLLAFFQGASSGGTEVKPPTPPPLATLGPLVPTPTPLPETIQRDVTWAFRSVWGLLLFLALFVAVSLALQRVLRGRARGLGEESGQR